MAEDARGKSVVKTEPKPKVVREVIGSQSIQESVNQGDPKQNDGITRYPIKPGGGGVGVA